MMNGCQSTYFDQNLLQKKERPYEKDGAYTRVNRYIEKLGVKVLAQYASLSLYDLLML